MRLLADMALFVEVANTQHFARAAAALEIPPSTLSRRIAALERELGVTLIRRSTRSFALTDAGALCYARARKLISEAGRIRDELGANAGTISGHIRIGLEQDLAQTIFVPVFSEFARQNPGVTVEVVSVHGYPNLLAQSLDLAFLPAHQTAMPDSSQRARRIGSFSRKLFASKAYLRSRRAPKEPADLEDHECLLFSMGTLQRQWELRRGRERCTVAVKGTAAADSVGLLASLARTGLGIALLPGFLARSPGFGGGLAQILPEWQGVPAYIFAVTPMPLLPAKVRKLVDFAKAQFLPTLARLEDG